jgi:hypothetical protein
MAMFDDPPLSTTLPQRTKHARLWAQREANSPQVDELFDGRAKRLRPLDSTGVERCSRWTLGALIAAAALSATLTAYIAVRGLPPHKPMTAPGTASEASHAGFGPLRP